MAEFTIAQLVAIHPGYQRPVSEHRARKYAANYDPNQVRSPIVSLRDDGSAVVIDGQHTVAMLGIVHGQDYLVTCETRQGLTYEQEASLYVRLNRDRKDNTAIEAFLALIEAGDTESIRINTIIEKHGFRVVNGASNHASAGSFRAIQTAISIARRDEGLLGSVLMLIADTCYFEQQSTNAAFIRGIAGMLMAPNIDLPRLHRVLGDHEPAYFLKHSAGGSASRQCYERLADRYNHKLQSESKRVTTVPPVGIAS